MVLGIVPLLGPLLQRLMLPSSKRPCSLHLPRPVRVHAWKALVVVLWSPARMQVTVFQQVTHRRSHVLGLTRSRLVR